jgi:hypothetical protein
VAFRLFQEVRQVTEQNESAGPPTIDVTVQLPVDVAARVRELAKERRQFFAVTAGHVLSVGLAQLEAMGERER